MKITSIVIVLFFSSLAGLQAQNTVVGTATQPTQNQTPPPPTAYAVVANDANSRVWQRTVYELDASGNPVPKLHQYTELATGLNHLVNGQWAASSEQINILPNGTAAAVNGQHQAYFPGDIYNGRIELVTPDGLQLFSQPLCMTYFDGTNTVTIAELTNSTGVVVGDNEVIYPNAFTGISADLRYTYTISGFEQDVILHQQPPTPESLGLNADTARIELLTEFFNPPQPTIQSTVLPAQAGLALTDQSLGFGAMQMIQGRAFLLGEDAQDTGVLVSKEWMLFEGRQILVEEVPVDAIVQGLAALPLAMTGSAKSSYTVSRHLVLPAQRLVKNNLTQSIKLAKAGSFSQGFVLDYQTINTSKTNFTFQGDTTYYISGSVNLYGTNTFEGGAVLKYPTNSASLNFGYPATINCVSSAYRPVVFTAKDDNSVGEYISGSTGNPTNYYANPALNFSASFGYSYSNMLSNFRIARARQAINGSIVTSVTLYNGQMVNCLNGINWSYGTAYLRNILFANVQTNFYFNNAGANAQNATFSGSSSLLASGSSGSLDLTNCILANVVNLTNSGSSGSISAGYNGFYNAPPVGSSPITNTFYPFQTLGAGSYYLTNGCAFTNAGTSVIDSTLLASLNQRTTHPPILYTNVSFTNVTTFSPQAQRDTNSSPDLGYHYDPLDYILSACYLYTNLTATAGTAIGCYDNYGDLGFTLSISLKDGANFTLNGTATEPCWVTEYKTVQEGGNGNWGQGYGYENILIHGSGAAPIPRLNATFTKWPALDACDAHFQDPGGYGYSDDYGAASFSDCEFYIPGIVSYRPSYYFTNCLFFREQLDYWAQRNAASCALQNCTFYNGFFALCRSAGQSNSFWNIQNTAFDGTAIFMQDNYSGNTNYTYFNYNAYNTGNNNWQVQSFGYTVTNKLEVVGPQDVIVTSGYNWQSSWFGNFYQPTNSLLLNVGNTNANLLGLYHFTVLTNQTVEGTNIVSIGYHYVATDTNGVPLDSNGDGIPDYIEDANGDGLVDNGETNWGLAILVQPVNQTVSQGVNVTNSVTAMGVAPLNYQWYFNGISVAGANSSTLVLPNIQVTNEGNYCVIVTNVTGCMTSSVAMIGLTCDTSPSGMVAWWQAESNAFDSVGTNNGVLTNGDTFVTGKVGLAFNFDGTNGEVQVPDSSVLKPTNLTIETWVKFNKLISITNGGAPPYEQFIIEKPNSAGADGYVLYKIRTNSAGPDSFAFGVNNQNTWPTNVTSAPFIQTNVWYQIVGVRGSNYIQLYTNGMLAGTTTYTSPQNYGSYPLCFGYSGGFNNNTNAWDARLAGSLDEVTLYNRALSSNEIAALYNAGSYGKCQLPPTIITQPVSQTVGAGTNVSFFVVASGSPWLNYQWYLNETNQIASATNATLILTNVQTGNAGNYSVLVSNGEGAVTSTNALLTVSGGSRLTVSLTSPTNGQTMLARTSYTISATATNPTSGITISWVQFFAGSNSLGFALSPSNGVYTLNWTPPYGGTNVFTALAQDSLGSNAISAPVTAYVRNLPSVTITSPTNGQTFLIISPLTSTNIVLNVTATPDGATIAKVAFYQGTNAIGTNSISPFGITWNGATNGIYTLTAQATDSTGLTGFSFPVVMTVYATNRPPTVYAGPDQITNLPNAVVQLTGFASDDGLPSNYLAVTWSQIDGPGNVVFSNSTAQITTAVFTNVGTYLLQLVATDGQLTSISTNTITVLASNAPPFVYAGPNLNITNPSIAATPFGIVLQGLVTDDGYPLGGSLIATWSVVSGAGPVIFADVNLTNTIATFTQPGNYQLQLTATDGQLTSSSNVTITIISPDAIVYGATGYLYTYPEYTNPPPHMYIDIDATNLAIPNYYTTNFDDSSWSNGQGGFSYALNGDYGFGCDQDLESSNYTKTYWPGQSVVELSDSGVYYPYLFIRRHFNVPPGTTNLSMGFTVDNDAQVYINGILITPSNVVQFTTSDAAYPPSYTSDPGSSSYSFFTHEECPTYDDITLNGIYTNIWHTNDNLLAVCAFDEGGLGCYFDTQIRLNAWITETNSLPLGTNQAPLVYAGWNQFLILTNDSATTQLNGLVVDDGLPGNGSALATWTNISGPGPVEFDTPTNTFTNYNVITTTAIFTTNGIYTINLVADDGELSATGSVTVVVFPGYTDPGYTSPPAISLTAPVSGASYLVGDTIPLAATASAASGSTVTQVEFYSYSSTASHELIGRATTNPFIATWNNLVAGDYALTAEATDNGGRVGYSTNQVDIQISVLTNHPPVAVDDHVTVLANSVNNIIYPLANDYDADTNSLTITALTSRGMTASSITTYNGGTATIINNGQAVSYTPTNGASGGDGFTYYISDGKGGTAMAGIIVNIYASVEPSVILTAATGTTNAGAIDPLTANVSPYQNIAFVNFYQGETLLETVTNGSGGSYIFNWQAISNSCGCGFTAQATDIFGQVNTSSEIGINVITPSGSVAPNADLDAIVGSGGPVPMTNSVTIRDGLFELYGRAYQAQGSNVVWQLGVYSSDGTTLLRSLVSSNASTVGSATSSNILANCDLSTLINGVYELRLSVIGDYIETEASVPFILESGLKLGQFSFSQQDLAIPLAGIPLTVTRTYNSINPDKGDFGYGWTYALGSMDVSLDETRENVFDLAGDDGEDDLPSGTFSLRNGGGYDVTLTLPNGQRTTFYFQLSSADANNNCQPQWQAAPGVTATLGVQGNPLYNLGEGGSPGWYEIDNGSEGVPYNNMDFKGFVLTNQDGTLYYINRDDMGSHSPGGDWLVETYGPPYLARIVQRSGDTITINPNSIVHVYSNAVTTQIEFQRNADGLISSVTDPNGTGGPAAIQYIYDNNDNLISVLNLVDRDDAGTYVTNTFSYNNANFPHFITGIINANGTPVAKNIYDDSGKLVEVDDANGNRTLFSYNTTNDTQTTIDRLGNTNTYVYDTRGNVLTQTNALGQVTTMAYDVNNNKTNEITYLNGLPYATNSYVYDTNLNLMLASTDPLGHTATFAYNSYGELTNSTDANHNSTTNNYDGSGNLISTSDALGNTTINIYGGSLILASQDAIGTITTNYYDTANNVIGTAILSAAGAILSSNSFTYDDNLNRLSSTVWRHVGSSWVGATTTYVYDGMNRVIQTINPDGGTNTVVYNAIGKQQATTDPLGNIISYAYDNQGRLIQTTNADGTIESSAYDANGNRISSTDQEERTTAYIYDALNRLVQTIYPDNTTNTTVYDGVGRTSQKLDARGTITAFAYDAAGRRLAVTNAVGIAGIQNVSSYGYDANGNQITFTDANIHTTTNVFDALNRQVQVQYPDGTKTSTGYDADGRSVVQTNQDGFVTRFGYDGAGRLISVTNALNQITRYQYDEAGNQIFQVDALNRTNIFAFDAMNRRIAHVMPGGQTETFGYDLTGNLLYDTNFNGAVIASQYDALNRLTNRASTGSYDVNASYTYTPTGQRATMVDNDNNDTTIYSYDNRDRLVVKTTTVNEINLCYSYDANGNVTNLWSNHYEDSQYDNGNPYGGVTNGYQYDALNRLTTVLANGSKAADYAYDQAGNLQSLNYGNGVTNLYQYDSLNRLTNQVWKYGSSPRASFYYQLGLSGNRTNLGEVVNGTSHSYAWSYDHLYRLTNETISVLGSLGYGYDPVGNRASRGVTGSLSLSNQMPTYTTNDWLAADGYDADGNTTNSSNHYYQYDDLNHLVNVDNGVITYTYDGDGNRVSKTVGGGTTYYLFDDRNPSGYPQVVEESQQEYLSRVYNYGLALVSQQQVDNAGATTNVSYYGTDGHGSVRFLTDTNGTITDTYAYDAYGTIITQTFTGSAPTPNNYLYCGQQYDPDLGLYYNRARYLNPNTGRFWTADSVDGNNEDPLSLHKYLYAQDDPVMNADPSGNSVYVCTRPLNVSGLSILAPVADHVFLAFDTDGITSTADLNRWTKVVEDGNKNVAGQYAGLNYSSDPYLTTFSFHPYSVFAGNGERNEAGVFTTTGSYVAYNDNIDHNAFYLAGEGYFRYGRYPITSDLNEQIALYTLAKDSRNKNNSGHPEPAPYSALECNCASWTYYIVQTLGFHTYPLFLTEGGVGIHGPFAPVGAGITGLVRGFNPQFDLNTGEFDMFDFSF
jgi:RHS repeat-associated protein